MDTILIRHLASSSHFIRCDELFPCIRLAGIAHRHVGSIERGLRRVLAVHSNSRGDLKKFTQQDLNDPGVHECGFPVCIVDSNFLIWQDRLFTVLCSDVLGIAGTF